MLRAGKLDGTADGGAIVGALATIRGNMWGLMPAPNRPAERFCTAIKKGDKPASNSVARLIEEWLAA